MRIRFRATDAILGERDRTKNAEEDEDEGFPHLGPNADDRWRLNRGELNEGRGERIRLNRHGQSGITSDWTYVLGDTYLF